MDSPTPSSETPIPSRRRTLRRLLFLAAFVIFALLVLLILLPAPAPRFAWLTPAELQQATRPSRFTLIKYKLEYLAGPLLRHLPRHPVYFIISSTIFTAAPEASIQTNLGPPFATNAGGLSAWIVPADQIGAFRRALRTNGAVSIQPSPQVQVGSGVQASASIGQNVSLIPGTYTNVGITMDTAATPGSGFINLLIGVSSTALSSSSSNTPVIKTNFSTACQVTLPQLATLLVRCGQTDSASPSNYWLLVSPAMIDTKGKPVKK